VVDLQIGGQTRSMVRQRLEREGALGSTVEFGCGTGFYTETLADKTSAAYIAARRLVSSAHHADVHFAPTILLDHLLPCRRR